MTKFKIKSGDTVTVIAGDHKGSEGKVLQILEIKNRAIVEGVNMFQNTQNQVLKVLKEEL